MRTNLHPKGRLALRPRLRDVEELPGICELITHRMTITSHGHLLLPHEEYSLTSHPITEFPVYARGLLSVNVSMCRS